ncbi:MAG: hypothetical protein WBZ22_06835, partial [Pseudolabrys sp.]
KKARRGKRPVPARKKKGAKKVARKAKAKTEKKTKTKVTMKKADVAPSEPSELTPSASPQMPFGGLFGHDKTEGQ